MTKLIKGSVAYNEALNRFNDCYKVCAENSSLPAKIMFYMILELTPGTNITHSELDNITDSWSLENRSVFKWFAKQWQSEMIQDGFTDCLETIAEKVSDKNVVALFKESEFPIDYESSSNEAYVKAGDDIYRLLVDKDDFDNVIDNVNSDIIGIHII